jgi:nicotinate-nucleotide pyrophosphorylase (carboxylating)
MRPRTRSSFLLDLTAIRTAVSAALREDVGTGDVTTAACVPPNTRTRGEFILKQDAVVAGLPVAEEVFRQLDPEIRFTYLAEEGDRLQSGDLIARVEGAAAPILTAERTALNFVQRISGIATLASQYVEALKETRCRLLDTRKTAPGLRVLDKYGVRVGGGTHHRFGLFDGILIKDNHIAAAGGVGPAVQAARKSGPPYLKIEIEVTSLAELREALDAGADALLLDNMDPTTVAAAVRVVNHSALLEVSGNVSLETAPKYAALGIDFISVGELTHSVRAADISLEFTAQAAEV